MTLFNKIIASFGVGSAKVDTKIAKRSFVQGETLFGIVELSGGISDQKINVITLHLKTLYGHENSDRLTPTTIYSHSINDPFILKQGDKKEIPFSFEIPLGTPITMRDPETSENVPPVWIETDVSIKGAVNQKDKDFISIEPTDVHESIIEAIKMLGFRFRQMESQKTPQGIKSPFPFVQQFEFIPSFRKFAQKLDELEIYILQQEHQTTIYFEVDKKSKGPLAAIVEKLDLDEHRGYTTFNNQEILESPLIVSEQFERIINKFL